MADFLSQEEIDALLNGKVDLPVNEEVTLNDMEKDALGEIGNISMGSAATALSQILNKRVLITTPATQIMTPAELFSGFKVPYILVEVNFTTGVEGSNLLIMKVSDAAIIADLMMGGSGQDTTAELDDIKSSAVAEAMNQMIGSAATAMSTIFQRSVKISPPRVTTVNFGMENYISPWAEDQAIAVVYFKMEVEDLIDSQIMQVMPVEVARTEVDMLMNPGQVAAPPENKPAVETGQSGKQGTSSVQAMATAAAAAGDPALEPLAAAAGPAPSAPEPIPAAAAPAPAPPAAPGRGGEEYHGQVYGTQARNIDLILDVPLDIEVILGTAMKRIQEILNLAPGAIVELDRLVEEPVQITVNGTPIARGEVVVVNENFGVRITHILEPYERINHLRH